MKRRFLFLSFLLFSVISITAQNTIVIDDIEKLLTDKKYKQAEVLVKERVASFFQTGKIDSIVIYISYVGKIAEQLHGRAQAVNEQTNLLAKTKTTFKYHSDIIDISFLVSDFVSNSGKPEQAYKIIEDIKTYFISSPDSMKETRSRVESNLGSYAMGFGNYALSAQHYRESLRLLQLLKDPDPHETFIAYNSMGIVMWYTSKLDSCLYFFDKAVATLYQQDSTPLNRNFRVAMLQNNMGNVYSELGRVEESIQSFNKAIDNYQRFIVHPEPHMRKEYASKARLQAIENLAQTYLGLGDFTKGQQLLLFAYEQKERKYGKESMEVYKSLVYLGTQYYTQREYDKSLTYLNEAVRLIGKVSEQRNIWEADAYLFLALNYDQKKDAATASKYFDAANEVYNVILKEGFSTEYMQFIQQISAFYARQGQEKKAVEWSEKGLNYVLRNQGEKSLPAFHQLLNLAEVNFEIGRYTPTVKYAKQSLVVLDHLVAKSDKILDSVLIERDKPVAILLQVKAEYELTPDRTVENLQAFLQKLKEATQILEKRKTIYSSAKDITTLNARYKDLLEFMKKLQLELFEKTGNSSYLDDMTNIQEAALYSRIRSRMEKQKGLSFLNVPDSIIQQEEKLKAAVNESLQTKRSANENITGYLAAINKLNDFKTSLQSRYPDYYKMRYALEETDIATVREYIPDGTTVVRYMLAGEKLIALIADKQKSKYVLLKGGVPDSLIAQLSSTKLDAIETGKIAYQLYQLLWQPFEKEIQSKRVMIIPDGALHNLSFEMLSPVPVKDFGAFAKECLLNRYAIAYHYSLLAIKPHYKKGKTKDSFIGFAPGFSDEGKGQYKKGIKNDSIYLDNMYLSLLPQPFTVSLVRKIQRRLGGSSFVDGYSTSAVFKTQAGNHSIIHIGTHAEASNVNPEYSRLIFTKDYTNVSAENSVYLLDIYNCNLQADLAVLAACESGKPGYQDGEGMISMAHAFNYAGSESIMTGLWKIDEQTSTMITEAFYENLQKGLSKDEALQQAKLAYLQKAEGRLLHPQYWAGLMIMGDTSPIEISKQRPSYTLYIVAGVLLLLGAGFIIYNKRKRS